MSLYPTGHNLDLYPWGYAQNRITDTYALNHISQYARWPECKREHCTDEMPCGDCMEWLVHE